MKGMKGNIVIGLFMTLIVLIVFAGMIGYMNTQITNIIAGGSLNTMDETLLRLIPTAILFTILAGVIGGKMAEGII